METLCLSGKHQGKKIQSYLAVAKKTVMRGASMKYSILCHLYCTLPLTCISLGPILNTVHATRLIHARKFPVLHVWKFPAQILPMQGSCEKLARISHEFCVDFTLILILSRLFPASRGDRKYRTFAVSILYQIKEEDCTICAAKSKALICCAVTAQLICAFVFA